MPEFSVPDMHCDGCIASLTKAIHAVDPAAEVMADLGKHQVRTNSPAPIAALIAAMEDAGFTVAAAQ